MRTRGCSVGAVARGASVGLAAWLALACGEKPAAEVSPPPVAAVAPRAPAPGDPSCPRDGTWKECALVDRVVHAGLGFKPANDTVTVAYLAPRGVRYKVGRSASLIAFYYADTVALAKDWKELDTLRLTPVGDTVGAWPERPGDVIRSANLIAVLFSGDAQQRERMRLAITAGAPQAPREPLPQTLPPAIAR